MRRLALVAPVGLVELAAVADGTTHKVCKFSRYTIHGIYNMYSVNVCLAGMCSLHARHAATMESNEGGLLHQKGTRTDAYTVRFMLVIRCHDRLALQALNTSRHTSAHKCSTTLHILHHWLAHISACFDHVRHNMWY